MSAEELVPPTPAPADVAASAPPEETERAQEPARPAKGYRKQAKAVVATASVAPRAASGPVEITVLLTVTTGDGRVKEVVDALGAELDRLGRVWECVVVFDGVKGRAYEEACALATLAPDRVFPLTLGTAFGESTALAAGFERARGKIIVTTPQYVQIDPFEIEPMLAELDAGADFVTPWRDPRIDPYLNRVQSALFNWVMRKILHSRFHDLNCTFRCFRREVLADASFHGDMARFLPASAARQGFKVVERKVRHLQEWGGANFFGIGVYVRRALDLLGVVFLTKFTHKPLRFFGSLGGLFAIVGGLLCGTLAVQHLVFDAEGPIISRSVFLIGLLLFVLGVQIVGFGLVAEIIIFTQARNLRQYRIERVWENGVRRDERDDAGRGTQPQEER